MCKILVVLTLASLALAFGRTDDAGSWQAVNHQGSDAPFDSLQYIDVEGLGASVYCVGVGFDGTDLWVTDANQEAGAPVIHVISTDGSLVETFDQYQTSSWGLRDMCCDGTYMFASEDYNVDAYDIATRSYAGSFTSYASNPNRAQGWDGTYFYTGSFSETIYQVEWDGVFGSSATYSAWSTAVANGGLYGTAYDETDDCIWASTASYDGMVYQIAMDGSLIAEHDFDPEVNIAGGCCTAPWEGTEQYWILEQGDPDAVWCFQIHTPATTPATWGTIKSSF
ncbi:hypothetical protein GF402_04355 [Candidatus Fermentibacteria bacterium]|nr:hypothetical protein [Candidatus Fermentibacteria bacterium]